MLTTMQCLPSPVGPPSLNYGAAPVHNSVSHLTPPSPPLSLKPLIKFLCSLSVSEKFPDPSNFEMTSSWILSVKVASISAVVLSTAFLMKLSFPALLEFLTSEVPHLWSIAVTCLKPPYLYLVLNCIILTIVASSKLQPQKSETVGFAAPVQIHVPVDTSFVDQSPIKDADVQVVSPVLFGYVDEIVEEILDARSDEEKAVVEEEEEVISALVTENDEFVLSRSNWMPPRKRNPVEYYSVSTTEKPLVSQRIGYRRSVKASPEGGKMLLGVSRPKRQDTLESTWRKITEGRPMPLTRHLKKSETFDMSPSTSPAHLMKKSETFNDSTSNSSSLILSQDGGSVRLRRDPSLSQDELNRRVEAFIRKFNEEMRLQRLESLKQYSEIMVGHGSEAL